MEKKKVNKKTVHKKSTNTTNSTDKTVHENFVIIQRVMTELAEKLDNLTSQISGLLNIFETSAQTLAKKSPENNQDIIQRLDKVIDQNKILAQGISLLHEEEPEEKPNSMPQSSQQSMPKTPQMNFQPNPPISQQNQIQNPQSSQMNTQNTSQPPMPQQNPPNPTVPTTPTQPTNPTMPSQTKTQEIGNSGNYQKSISAGQNNA